MDERGLSYLVKKYTERAHVRNVCPYTLRHRFGHHMAASVPLHRLVQLMGYDPLYTTIRFVQAPRMIYCRTSRALPGDERLS